MVMWPMLLSSKLSEILPAAACNSVTVPAPKSLVITLSPTAKTVGEDEEDDIPIDVSIMRVRTQDTKHDIRYLSIIALE